MLTMRPPTITIAKGRCESDPIPWDMAAGRRPNVATRVVMRIGLRRRMAPSMAASTMEWPRARS